jgi:hypothetical protein
MGDDLGSLKNEGDDKVKKYAKKHSGFDAKQQKEADEGDMCFDEIIIAGCKFYAVKKTLINGDTIEMCKLKGYREKDKPLSFDDYVKLMTGEVKQLEQEQTQFNIPKSAMIDEQRNFGLKTLQVRKTRLSQHIPKGLYRLTGRYNPSLSKALN